MLCELPWGAMFEIGFTLKELHHSPVRMNPRLGHPQRHNQYVCEVENERCNNFGVNQRSRGHTQGALADAHDPGL